MAKKAGIDWKALEKETGEIVSTSSANVIKLKEGETFTGKYNGSEEITISGYDPFMAFNFTTEQGEQSFSGGINFAQQMRMINIGAIIRVTHAGKKKNKNNPKHKTNQWTIEALTPNAVNEKEREKIKNEITLQMKTKKNKIKKGKK